MFCFTLALEEEQENKLEELYNRYHLDLIRFAHSIVNSTEEAEDIVQEAFIRIFRNIAKIENSTDREAKNFMLITVRRLCYTHLARKRLHLTEPISEEEREPEDDPVWSQFSVKHLQSRMVFIIKGFSQQEQQLLVYGILKKYTYKELADLFGMNEKTVSVKLSRIRKKLRRALEREGEWTE